jgi:hypothetical protein
MHFSAASDALFSTTAAKAKLLNLLTPAEILRSERGRPDEMFIRRATEPENHCFPLFADSL